MGLTDWMGAFDRASTSDLSLNLERAYEAALQIQGIELEFYSDRPVRPELQLSVPKQVQAQILRRFRAALQICQDQLPVIQSHRAELDSQELRQLQLIESVLNRYRRRSTTPSLSRSPEMLPRSLLGVFDGVRRQLDPEAETAVIEGFRRRRSSTLVSLRIFLLLILVPLIVQQTSRSLLISPLLDRFAPDIPFLSYTKPHLQEKAVNQLRIYQQELEFEALLEGKTPPTPEEIKAALMAKANQLAGSLGLLDRKRLELTRALCANPKLLLLDEIAGGLTDAECQELVATIQQIRSRGISIIWIEHIVHALLAIVDRLIVIDFGKIIAEGEPDKVMASKEVREIYLGIEADG